MEPLRDSSETLALGNINSTKDSLHTLEQWYSSLNPRHVDIVGDFAGRERFVVHGEGLVLRCIVDADVDVEGGFQLLHAVWAMEKFLAELERRGCNFDILFFDDHVHASVPGDSPGPLSMETKFRLARGVLIEHLMRHNSSCSSSTRSTSPVFVFGGFQSVEFRRYLENNTVHFFWCHAGSGTGSVTKGKQAVLRLFIYQLVSERHHVALLDDVVFQSSKIFTPLIAGSNLSSPFLGLPNTAPSSGRQPETPSHCKGLLDRIVITPLLRHRLSSDLSNRLSIRELITVLALFELLVKEEREPSPELPKLVSALVLHTAVLRQCALADRPCREVNRYNTSPDRRVFSADFLDSARVLIQGLACDPSVKDLEWDLHDFFDGRVFDFISNTLLGHNHASFARFHARAQFLLDCLNDMLSSNDHDTIDFCALQYNETEAVASTSPKNETCAAATVLPFSHPVLDKHLAPVRLACTGTELEPTPQTSRIFAELTHWHTHKKGIDPRKPPPKPDFKAHKRRQILMADILKYAASLTNAAGKNLEPETIVTSVSHPFLTSSSSMATSKKRGKEQTKQQPKQGKQGKDTQKAGKGGGGGKAAALAAANNRAKEKSQAKGNVTAAHWKQTVTEIEGDNSLLRRYAKALKYIGGRSAEALAVIGPEAHLYLCNVLVVLWEKYCRDSQKQKGLDVIAIIWDKLLQISRMDKNRTLAVVQAATEMTVRLGLPLPEMAASNSNSTTEPRDELVFRLAMKPEYKGYSIPLDARTFQLLHAGPYMERSFDSAPDDRVSFAPDAWQRRVLDSIDADHSVLVVAPTSAGKTFISFYAMKKVLRTAEDVLVYVAPTKALVNQIAAEVAARFTKSYATAGSGSSADQGRSVWAIHTRDHRVNNPTGCQVLVTVPHILQTMLLSPNNLEWSRRVRRIIFDEVHCIGQADDGVVWEQLLLLAPCPIIALSATIGNVDEFRDWLSASQKQRGYELDMIVHGTRYSDLRKFVYRKPTGGASGTASQNGALERRERLPFPGLVTQSEEEDKGPGTLGRFCFVHPIAALLDYNRGNLEDIHLEPRDCFTLWKAMKKHQTTDFPIGDSLDPGVCMQKIISKSDAIAWENSLKQILQCWMGHHQSSPFRSVRDELLHTAGLPNLSVDETNKGFQQEQQNAAPGEQGSDLIPLLYDLHRQDALPALIFNHDRMQCETGLKSVYNHLVKAEDSWKVSSKEWSKKLEEYTAWKKAKLSVSAKAVGRAHGGKGAADDGKTTKLQQVQNDASVEASPWEDFDPDYPREQFSFGNQSKLSRDEFEEMTKWFDSSKVNPWLVEALKRGIGVHHAGLNRKYRQVVEILFRKGYLGVVIATGTLALGINMPCKTVVFCGDSVFLTALNYRQASGRAGRRGFDLLGNVVFADMPAPRALEIMSSRLPDLKGQFPMSTTLVLRLLTLLHGTKRVSGKSSSYDPYAVDAIDALLSQTRFYLGGPRGAPLAIAHHVRFSIEYLRRQHFLSAKGAPLNFSGLVSHLYFTENAAFAFHTLLKDGYFHRVCTRKRLRANSESLMLELMLVMANLFGRIPVLLNITFDMEAVKRSPSVVLLPGLPESANEVLVAHNTETLELFKGYVRSYVSQHLDGVPDDVLPFTGTRISAGQTMSETGTRSRQENSATLVDERPLDTSVQPHARVVIRSPFAALSGHTDSSISSIHDLCSTVREGVFLEESAIPHIPAWRTEDGSSDTGRSSCSGSSGLPLNAYLYDFFKHGDIKALSRDNRIKAGDEWFLLKDFSLVLATIVTSLKNFLGTGNSHEYDGEAGDGLGVPYAEDGDEHGGEDEYHEGAATNTPTLKGRIGDKVKGKGRAVVLDDEEREGETELESWDDAVLSSDDEKGNRKTPEKRVDQPENPEDDGNEGLVDVLAAFTMLKERFDEKFYKIGA